MVVYNEDTNFLCSGHGRSGVAASASIVQRSLAAGFAEMPSFPAAIGRLNDVNVIFDEDLFDQAKLRVLFEPLRHGHC
jgi:hypothetical protein